MLRPSLTSYLIAGFPDQAVITAPIFLEYKCPLSFFVITGMLDQDIWPWDAQISWIIESSTTIKNLVIKFDENISKRTFRQSIQGALKKIDAEVIPDILQQRANDTDIIIPGTTPPSYQAITRDSARQFEDQGICFMKDCQNN